MDRIKRIFGYLRKYPEGTIKFRTAIPDHSAIEFLGDPMGWRHIYGDLTEELPTDMPISLGSKVRITTYVDANLHHCKVTGRSCTGILTLLNGTPIDWYSKKQSTVETTTYGSEFVAAKIATEQILDIRYTLRMFGAPLDGPAYMLGDNMSVVMNATIPASTLKKRHNALAYHRVREAIAMGIIKFGKIDTKENYADVLTKYLSNADAYPLLRDHLFWPPRLGNRVESHGGSRGVIDRNHNPDTRGASSRIAMSGTIQIGGVLITSWEEPDISIR